MLNYIHLITFLLNDLTVKTVTSQSSIIAIDKIAKSTNYTVFRTSSKKGLQKILKQIIKKSGPILILVKINKSNRVSKRVSFTPTQIKNRFMEAI